MTCKKCGAEYEGNFCSNCGTSLQTTVEKIEVTKSEEDRQERFRDKTRAGAILSLIGAIVGLIPAVIFEVLFLFIDATSTESIGMAIFPTIVLILLYIFEVVIYSLLIRGSASSVKKTKTLAIWGLVLAFLIFLISLCPWVFEISLCCLLVFDVAAEIILLVGALKTAMAALSYAKK